MKRVSSRKNKLEIRDRWSRLIFSIDYKELLNEDWNPIRIIFTITLLLAKYFEYKNSSISHIASPILYHPIPNEENLFIHILNKYCTTFLYQQLQFPLFVTK